MSNTHPVAAILMGSESDREVMNEAVKMFDEFAVPCEVKVLSAHRTPDRVRRFVRAAPGRGVKVLIAGAGKAAHLAGAVAANTTLPVIGVPLDDGLGGLDALLSTVQMPRGVPVATVAIGRTGAVNAALLAIQILALSDANLAAALARYRLQMARGGKTR